MIASSAKHFAKRTLLILGGTGFVGTNLADWLCNAGHRVLVTGRGNFTRSGYPAINIALGDVDAHCALIRDENVDTVIHLACQLLPSSTEADYINEVAQVNYPMFKLARQLSLMDVGLTYMSSGGTVYGTSTNIYASEVDHCQPISLYGQAKLEAELHLRFLARTCKLRLLILRPSNPYGLYQPLRGKQGLISVILGRMADNRPLDIWGDGSIVRDYIFVEDAVRSMGELITRDAEGIYNIGSGIGTSLIEVVQALEEVTGRAVQLTFRPARAADVPRLVLDVSRLAELGLHHTRSLAAGLQRYVEQLRITNVG